MSFEPIFRGSRVGRGKPARRLHPSGIVHLTAGPVRFNQFSFLLCANMPPTPLESLHRGVAETVFFRMRPHFVLGNLVLEIGLQTFLTLATSSCEVLRCRTYSASSRNDPCVLSNAAALSRENRCVSSLLVKSALCLFHIYNAHLEAAFFSAQNACAGEPA